MCKRTRQWFNFVLIYFALTDLYFMINRQCHACIFCRLGDSLAGLLTDFAQTTAEYFKTAIFVIIHTTCNFALPFCGDFVSIFDKYIGQFASQYITNVQQLFLIQPTHALFNFRNRRQRQVGPARQFCHLHARRQTNVANIIWKNDFFLGHMQTPWINLDKILVNFAKLGKKKVNSG